MASSTRTRSQDQAQPLNRVEGKVQLRSRFRLRDLNQGWHMWTFPLNRIVFFTVVLLVSEVFAQTTQGGIVGTIRDQKGAQIVGAKVMVTSPSTGLQRETTTADNGIFRIIALPTGVYEIKAEAAGFATATTTGIQVGVDQIRRVEVVLRVGAVAEVVEVKADAALTQTETSKLGEIIDNRKVEDLPLNGRDFAQLARLNPGVAVSGGGGGQQGGEGNVSGFSSNGQRSTSNNFLVDGVDNNNYFAGEPAQLPSIDSIQEFEVQTNTFAAEYGRNSGSVVRWGDRSSKIAPSFLWTTKGSGAEPGSHVSPTCRRCSNVPAISWIRT